MASKSDKLDLRTPKGTLDLSPSEALTQDKIIDEVVAVFKKHGGLPIETPTFELRPVLTNKYGEDSKLIYDLEDQGGDVCSLRYDLTVPFARYVASNRISRMRRYQVGHVYRRDNPSFRTGRLREFVQADFDICGEGLPMLADAEVLAMISEILGRVCGMVKSEDGAEFVIRINDRRIIGGMLDACGIPPFLSIPVCSTIDKADKLPWLALAKEFHEKGLDKEQITYIREYMIRKGSNEEMIEFLEEKWSEASTAQKLREMSVDESTNAGKAGTGVTPLAFFRKAIDEMKVLLCYAKAMGATGVSVDLSLARGLDYYTGLIIEASFTNCEIGSVLGGGRYDGLCSSLSRHSVPCVGFSVGVSRIRTVAVPLQVTQGVFVGSAHGLLLEERLKLLSELWAAGFSAQTFSGKRVNFNEQLESARKQSFSWAVFIGEKELEMGKAFILNVVTGDKTELERSQVVAWLLQHGK